MSELLNINKKISYAKTKIKFLERKLSKYKKEETTEGFLSTFPKSNNEKEYFKSIGKEIFKNYKK